MLQHFLDWLNTLLFLVLVSLLLMFLSNVFLEKPFSFFESFGIGVFVINIIGITSQLIRFNKDDIE